MTTTLAGPDHGLALSAETQDLLFCAARTASTFTDEPVSDEQIRAVYDLIKPGVRAAGLAAGPMTGFDADGINADFLRRRTLHRARGRQHRQARRGRPVQPGPPAGLAEAVSSVGFGRLSACDGR